MAEPATDAAALPVTDPAALLALLLAGGALLQWVAWRLHLPSILLLLLAGFAISPAGIGLLDPQTTIGNQLLFPLVALSVALILFEGGLSLQLSELGAIHRSLRGLVTVGVLLAWMGGSAAAVWWLELTWPVAAILGAILVVTGPTVIVPLLQSVRPKGRIGAVVKWEGILNDPIGAVLAVLVFEAVLASAGTGHAMPGGVLGGLALALAVGVGIGGACGLVASELIARHWVPDRLQGVVTIALVIGAFTISNALQHESGLLTVTIAGLVLINRKRSPVGHVVDLLEHLREILIPMLFLILGARLTTDKVTALGWGSLVFTLALILVVRPFAVQVSLLRTALTWRERLFVSWMAPRGIVAVAVASLFGLELASVGVAGGELLEPVELLVVVATVSIYGLTARPLCKLLGLAERQPRGVLILGAHDWALELAAVITGCGIPVTLVDTNRRNVLRARMRDLTARALNLYREGALERLDLDGIGCLLALTANNEANSLAALRCIERFGRGRVFQIASADDDTTESEHERELRGHILWSEDATWDHIQQRWDAGWHLVATSLTGEFDIDDFHVVHGADALPMLVIRKGWVIVVTVGESPTPQAGDVLIALVPR